MTTNFLYQRKEGEIIADEEGVGIKSAVLGAMNPVFVPLSRDQFDMV